MKPLCINFFTAFIFISTFLYGQAPNCPTTFTPANGTPNQSLSGPILTWNPVTSANGYNVYLSTSDSSSQTSTNLSTNDTSIMVTDLLPNTKYYWQVRPKNSFGVASGCTVQNFTTGNEVANNECNNAEDISDRQPHYGNTWFANGSSRIEACKGTVSAGADVWYSFAIRTTETVVIKVTPNSPQDFDPIIFAYSGTCSNLQAIACIDTAQGNASEVLTLPNLTAGTYYIRVYQWGGDIIDPAFNINIVSNTLPITLSSFTGKRIGSKAILNWITNFEQNNKGFELEKSLDGTNFSKLSFVDSKGFNGNSNTSLIYSFEDGHLHSSNSYYRLKQVDKDGKFTLSNVLEITDNKPDNLVIAALYPNPAKDKVSIIVSSPSNSKIILLVTDVAGKPVLQQWASLISGDNLLSINVANISSGNYLIKVTCSQGCETSVRSFVKQ